MRNAFMNDFVRGWKRRNFWVMETQPGSVNWSPLNNALDPGETRALAWQAIGHGADALLYWQWRSALNGQEQYHGAIVGPGGKPLPLYAEVQQLGEDLQKTSAALQGTQPVADVALLVDYDSRWAIDFQLHNKNYDQLEVLLDYYKVLRAQGRTVDVVSAYAPLAQYKLVVAPSLNVISQPLESHLLDYVKQGGNLILGPRSGMKDEYNALDPHGQPGPLAEALGAHVDQFYALDKPIPVGDGIASIWAEQLSTTTPEAKVLLRYGKSNGWLDDQPAVISRTIGTGSFTYIGTLLDSITLTRVLKGAGFSPYIDTSASERALAAEAMFSSDVELCSRSDSAHTVYIFINHGKASQSIKLAKPMHELLSDKSIATIDLPPQGVAVFTTESVR